MYITVTITTTEQQYHIQIDNKQRVAAGIEILAATGKTTAKPVDYYRSKMQKRIVSAYNTFEQEHIQSGDELTLLV